MMMMMVKCALAPGPGKFKLRPGEGSRNEEGVCHPIRCLPDFASYYSEEIRTRPGAGETGSVRSLEIKLKPQSLALALTWVRGPGFSASVQ